MKKVLFGVGIVIVFILATSLFFFKNSHVLSSELNVYNWEDYFGENTITDFEKEFGVKVNLYTYEDEEVLLGENLGKYDLVVASDVIIGDMISSGLIDKIDKSNIPNLKYIDVKCFKENFKDYAVPYFWGTTGLAINTKYISEDTNSWDVLWDDRNKGKIAVLNNPDEVIGMTARYIGLPLVPQTISQIKDIEKFALLQKPLLVGYMSIEEIQDLLISEELWAVHTYDGAARQAMIENKNIKYIIPREGGSEWVDNFVIIKNSPNQYTAEVFINYILRPEVSSSIAEYQVSYSCNKDAMELLGEDFLEKISGPSLRFLEYFSDYEEKKEITELKAELWEKLIK